MLHLERSDEIEQLRQMALHYGANFVENWNSGRLNFDNENGKGYITTYEMFPGLVSKTYSVKLNKELRLTKGESSLSPTYLIYCLKGHYLHKFSDQDGFEKIHKNQNVIISGGKKKAHEIVLPPNEILQISIILIHTFRLEIETNPKARRIEFTLNNIEDALKLSNKQHYFSEIDANTAEHAKVLIENQRQDDLGIIITEGAILNTLASQLLNREKYNNSKASIKKLNKKEFHQILELGDYIKNNLESKIKIKDLEAASGLYAKKLQEGFNFLYGESVGNLIQRLRLERAKQLLRTTDNNISQIAYAVGISSLSYFTKQFKKYYGVAPSEFRLHIESKGLLFELSYNSNAVSGIKVEDLKSIVAISKENNKKDNITGALVYHDGIFFQLIEGYKSDILKLYEAIKKDPRHTNVQLIYTGHKTKRTFKNWSMAYVTNPASGSETLMDGNFTYAKLDAVLDENTKSREVATDLLWRRVVEILKPKAS